MEVVIYQDGLHVGGVRDSRVLADVDFVFLGRSERAFHGLIDEVRVWNIVRTESEIRANMNRTLQGDEPGLVGYWRLDEGRGQAILDSSVHGNDGRLGTTFWLDSEDPSWILSDAPVQ